MMQISIIKPYIRATVNSVESWLSDMAEQGWRLADLHGWKFVFEKKEPEAHRYFLYYNSRILSADGIFFDYFTAKALYKSKSRINKKNLNIFEVDSNKIDQRYFEYVKLRNKQYQREFFWMAMLWLFFICFVLFILIRSNNNQHFVHFIWAVLIVAGTAFFYNTMSFIIMKKQKTGDGTLS